MKIPLSKIDIDDEMKNAVSKVLDSGKFILGDETGDFEEKFAKFCNVKYASCVSSGTAALFLTLLSLGVKKNDEIIVPSLSFLSTASSILMIGAKPRFVDVDNINCTIDPEKIEKEITKRTKGIIPVHLYGHPANMDKIKKIARDYSIFVLEDSSQAHGARYKKKMVGSLGDASCFSFYPSKNLTVCGDGGIVTSNNPELINEIKKLRNHGRTGKYIHHILGYNMRFNEMQAAIGKVMLKRLRKSNQKRRLIAKTYSKKLTSNKVIKPIEEKWGTHVYHMYPIRIKERGKLQKHLSSKSIGTGIHYPVPIHKQPIMKQYNKKKLPITEEICASTLSIPMFPSLQQNQQRYVIEMINRLYGE